MEENGAKTLFLKFYPWPDIVLDMEYYVRKDSTEREVRTFTSLAKEDGVDWEKYDRRVGLFCMKCGTFAEYKTEDVYGKWRDLEICKCGTKLNDRSCYSSNEPSYKRRDSGVMWRAFPYKVKISEKDDKIRIVVVSKNWYLNPVAMKPYAEKFTATVVINTKTGQSYCMSAVNDGKPVFSDNDRVLNASVRSPHGGYSEFDYIDEQIVQKDPEVLDELNKILCERIPGMNAPASTLREIADINYFRGLYGIYPGYPERYAYWEHKDYFTAMWRKLRKRYVKNEETFYRYLYWGCSDVATKSIKKILFKDPEMKWKLYFFHKQLGISNIDLLRSLLAVKHDVSEEVAFACMLRRRDSNPDRQKKLEEMIHVLKTSGKPDKWKISYLLTGEDSVMYLLDSAKMLSLCQLPADEILKYKNIRICHDALTEYEIAARDERYSREKEYGEEISALEDQAENVSFRVIRVPMDLIDLHEKFHNCVHTYMDNICSGSSIILEMVLNGNPAACIELDRFGRNCIQAYAACNKELKGDA